jgi:transposase
MSRIKPRAHVVTTTRKHKGKIYRSHLLRRSYRDGDKVRKETIANLTPLGDHVVEIVRAALRGKELVPVDQVFDVIKSSHHGHVQAVLNTMNRLGFEKLIASRPSRERDLVVGTVVARVIEPDSKLATTRSWHDTSLPEILGVTDADEDDVYAAMDWLLKRQNRIEKKLGARHLEEGGLVLFDLTSSYFEGKTCPLAKFGHNRDGKKGKLQVNYGLLTDDRGCPVAVSVFEGNTGDPKTLLPQVQKVKEDFGLQEVVLVGDRGMISQKQIDELKHIEGVDWLTALRTEGIRKLVHGGAIQLGLFDERNLFELTHPDYPGERLVACRNPELAKLRAEKRRSLLEATAKELERVRGMVKRGKLKGADEIGVRVGKVVNKYKVAKHFELDIRDDAFDFQINEQQVAAEATLDGIYVVRTSVPAQRLDTADTVRSYKNLSRVEQAFRSLKSIDLLVRPIGHRLEDRVRAHIFLCLLAYYVQWHMIDAWRPLLFADEDQAAKATRDPVAPTKRSRRALKKAHTKKLEDGTAVHSLRTLLKHMSTIVRNTCTRKDAAPDEPTFSVDTTPNPKQQRAYDLLNEISV